jgi:hypothetical protein
MRRAGIEPAPPRWQRGVLMPMNYRRASSGFLRQGDRRDSNPLISGFTARPLDHFAFRRHPHVDSWN